MSMKELESDCVRDQEKGDFMRKREREDLLCLYEIESRRMYEGECVYVCERVFVYQRERERACNYDIESKRERERERGDRYI